MRTNRRVRRLAGAGLLALSLLSTPAFDAPVGARTESTTTARGITADQQAVVDQINQTRTAQGRRTLPINGVMSTRAQRWAEHLRDIQNLAHRPAPYGTPRGWCAAAENVGRSGNGGSLPVLHQAFMRSTGHRANILNRRWTAVGVGVAQDGQGEYFVVHAFADFTC